MGFTDLYQSGYRHQIKSYFKDLLKVAFADGIFTREEEKFIDRLARKFGLTESEVDEILDKMESYEFYHSMDHETKFEQLSNMVKFIAIDGDIHNREIKLCRAFAISMNYSHEKTKQLINFLIEGISSNLTHEELYVRSRENGLIP